MLTVAQAASELGIQPGAVRDAIARGSMQAIRVGGRGVRAGLLLIQRQELERYHRDIKGRPGPKPKMSENTASE
ncbi:MAG: helix-turn-helix domain-containing protein [Thermomicrobiales bacterium]